DAEAASVLQRRHGFACGLDLGRIDLGEEHAGLDAAFGQNLAPGRNDQRVTVSLALVLMQARLCRRKDEAAGLDGAGAEQYMPMRLAGLAGEGRGYGQERRAAFGQRAIERGEAHVVADSEPDPAPGQVGDYGGLARLIVGGFA